MAANISGLVTLALDKLASDVSLAIFSMELYGIEMVNGTITITEKAMLSSRRVRISWLCASLKLPTKIAAAILSCNSSNGIRQKSVLESMLTAENIEKSSTPIKPENSADVFIRVAISK